jgi:hypothetical protein
MRVGRGELVAGAPALVEGRLRVLLAQLDQPQLLAAPGHPHAHPLALALRQELEEPSLL